MWAWTKVVAEWLKLGKKGYLIPRDRWKKTEEVEH